MDDITAFKNGRNKEMVEKVLKKLKREVEEKGLKLSITEGGKEGKREEEGKREAITSCKYLEGEVSGLQDERSSCSGDECCNVGRGLENEKHAAGGEEGEKKEVRCEIVAHQEKSGLPEELDEDWCEVFVEDGFCEHGEDKQLASRQPNG